MKYRELYEKACDMLQEHTRRFQNLKSEPHCFLKAERYLRA